ncbi:MAG: hypothetical protein UW46_C0006G0050 [Candidatus Yanofskybacteria bacterium GW2011_GWF1_44_227]|uniref:Uncharacterized protein n=1 Tax=Candidatus Yanofskybacteria bacterium GW2011_GWE2_40_11 TaxID=1619033 RepID=A0A0G0TRK1_9BACT|nr:MAG: hypothetical protein UT69_C0002G0045 [Candidatus Yanofskybacteria bacterium GW2011_GWE1_40_10]KKR40497.1 MAG: hypothetical protein UT75_C0008G0019 [Candidatus Yanofskybacteria bacterium GW2011_GWE2_40_11]KKT15435.1 MAG: hypothetical protein UV97_C0006G0002 [Candidatus Yanofskybacteria bacterium GW2011_GWF2_43_596]KKT53149.1 MAG: hypothetical protein UW46_C0006G0050 [Candidatus Yanofskybacteria bacterium GW2011_GWF1_44_227]OGN35502.1 MAG: hypothetical protein A2207_02060 [Candidatus Yano
MRIYHGGELAKRSYYLNVKKWELIPLEDGSIIEGEPKQIFFRLSLIETLFSAPLLGAVYVIFLPIAGFVVLAKVLCTRMRKWL